MQSNPEHAHALKMLTDRGIPTEAIVFAGDYVNVKKLLHKSDFKRLRPTKDTFVLYNDTLESYVGTMQYGYSEFGEAKADSLAKFYFTSYPILAYAN
jgi:hypothetical protein